MAELRGISMAQVDALIGDAVRDVAARDPDPTDPFRGLYMTDASAVETAAQLEGASLDARLERLVELLGLDPLDAALLGLCAAPVLDARYGRLVAYLHDDLTRRLPSPRLLARLLGASGVPEEHTIARLGARATLRYGGAIAMLDDAKATPAVDRLLALDDQLAAFLLGADLAPGGLPAEIREVGLDGDAADRAGTVDRVARAIAAARGLPVLCAGPDAEQVLVRALGAGLVVVDAARLEDERLVARARLRAALTGARLAVGGLDDVGSEHRPAFRRGLRALGDGPLLCARRARVSPVLTGVPHLAVVVPMPDRDERAALWAAHAPVAEAGEVAGSFVLSAEQIDHAAALASARARMAGRAKVSADDARDAARSVARRGLGEHATLLPTPYDWEDLVLADDELAVLESVAAHVRHRSLVLDTWGFGRRIATGPGLKVLFAGESGTGKTMASQVIARSLGLDLYRIDLSRTVSKFIGETEKNLARLFDLAEDANAVLLFDEADALFGKRSAVSDAHDRYANIEVAYLLQRIEDFSGVAILATNLRHNIDQAFLRRLDFVVDFPVPDRVHRRRLWERHLPDEAPVAADVDLDALADHTLSGGSIRNCVLRAAFAAADDGREISTAHIERALRLEHRKLGRLAVGAGSAE